MPRKKAEDSPPDIQDSLNISTSSDDTVQPSIKQPKSKKQRQKEPYKPFLLIADLGRSSCKTLAYFEGEEQKVGKLTSCIVKLDSLPGNDYGGFTLGLEEPTGEKDAKGRVVKVKTQEHWVVGDRAFAYPSPTMMTDKSDSKVEYFHILLMGVIASIPNLQSLSTGKSVKQRTLTIDLATLSIANSSELKKKLKLCKWLKVGDTKYRLNFTSRTQSFVEGHGAAIYGKYQFSDRSTLYVADLGAGTFQIAEFSVLNQLPSKKSKDSYHGGGGIVSLKREVTKALSNGDSSNYLTQSQIATILENSQWDNGRIIAQDFTKSDVSNEITYAINQWLRESPASFALEDLTTISRHSPIIFCGGGFQIAPVRGIIEKRILESGGEKSNLIFPEDLGLIAVRGVLDYITASSHQPNILQLHTKEIISHADTIQQTASA